MRQSVRKVLREEPQVRKEQILEEAIRIIGERGFLGFTIQELAKRCGLSNAGLLYYYNSKDHLLAAVLKELKQREAELITPIAERARRDSARNPSLVLDLFREIIAVGTADPERVRLVIFLRAEALDTTHPAHSMIRQRDKASCSLFTQLLAPYYAEPEIMARRVAAMLDGLAMIWIRSGQSFDIVEEWTQIAKALLPELAASAKLPRQKRATVKRV